MIPASRSISRKVGWLGLPPWSSDGYTGEEVVEL